jgi:hypothetical protein
MTRHASSDKKAQKATQDAKEARADYESEARTVRERTARLKALRLAKEAADLETRVDKKPIASKTTPSIYSCSSRTSSSSSRSTSRALHLDRVPSNSQATSPPCFGAGDDSIGHVRSHSTMKQCPIINPMLMRIATIAWPRRSFCCRIDVRFSQQWPECLTSPR